MKLFIIFLMLLFSTSCATIFTGSKQSIPVVTTPENATITIIDKDNNIILTKTTPCKIKIPRKKIDGSKIRVSKAGYSDIEIFLEDETNMAIFANGCCLGGFFIGAIIDVGNGSHRKAKIDNINLKLTPNSASRTKIFTETSNSVILEPTKNDSSTNKPLYQITLKKSEASLNLVFTKI